MEVIAAELGVSIATVSRALNGKPGISEAMRTKVHEELRKHGYRKRGGDGAAKKEERQQSLAFVVSNDLFEAITRGSDFYGRHLVAVQRAIAQAGYYPLLVSYEQDLNEEGVLRCVAEERVAGIIGESWNPALLERSKVPVVLFNRVHQRYVVDTVGTDLHMAAQTQLEYLYDLGHRRIACLRSAPLLANDWENTAYWQQYRSFMEARGLPIPECSRIPADFSAGEVAAVERFTAQLCAEREQPTAVVTYDLYAARLLEQLTRRGLSVPGDLSLCGFNDLQDGANLAVPLTTWRQPFDALAQEAVRLLEDRIRRSDDFPPRFVRIAGELVIRASCGPAPGGG